MKHLRTNLGVKVLAVVLCILCTTGAALGAVYTLRYWDGLFGRGYAESSEFYSDRSEYRDAVLTYLEECVSFSNQGSTDYLQQELLNGMAESLATGQTNFRFIVRNSETGTVLFSNTDGQSLDTIPSLTGQTMGTHTLYLYEEDVDYQSPQDIPVLSSDGAAPALPDGTALPQQVLIECGVIMPPTVQDLFYESYNHYGGGDMFWVGCTAAAAVAALVLLIFLLCAAGHKKGVDGVHRNWQDRIPLDLYLVGVAVLTRLGLWMVETGWFAFLIDPSLFFPFLVMVCGALLLSVLLLALLLTIATRLKSRTFFRNTVIWRLCLVIKRGIKALCVILPMSWRFALLFAGFLVANGVLCLLVLWSFSVFHLLLLFLIFVVFNLSVLFVGCRWVAQWKRIRAGTAEIVSGDTSAQIDTAGFFHDLKEHADQLNDLGTAINKAVEERMKSERFKAELITNVSHDLKTPLTSIINYVDLLKKEHIESETAQGYLEVLDRKSQRLKKLTEDLVEASKASTGTLTVNRERIGVSQLVSQAAAEYADRLEASRLELVIDPAQEALYAWADGRHLWRVLDNLLSNCCKYAMPGTRVYVDMEARGDQAVILVKNVSRDPLNVPAERLLERFVRGDDSRTTEGSGLGLSIAQSLTELQGGTFTLTVDGDFFKAEVSLPRATPISRDAVL